MTSSKQFDSTIRKIGYGALFLVVLLLMIQSSLNAAQPTVATTTGSITPGSAVFTGSIGSGLMDVTSVSSGSIAIGGVLTGDGYVGHVVAQTSGTPGGVWDLQRLANSCRCPPRHDAVGNLWDFDDRRRQLGAVCALARRSRAAASPRIRQSSSKVKGSADQWIVDLTQTVASSAMTMKAAPLEVTNNPVFGATMNTDNFWISVNGQYTVLPTTMTYASGSAATLLDLTQSTGAYASTPGEIVYNPSNEMNCILQIAEEQGLGFAQLQSINFPVHSTNPAVQKLRSELEQWAVSTGDRYLYQWNETTPPIVDSIPSAAPLFLSPGPMVSAPEASTWRLALLGFAGVGLARYWRGKKAEQRAQCPLGTFNMTLTKRNWIT